MRNKYTLYLLLCAVMIYFAVQSLNIFAQGLEGLFAVSWLIFALFVFAGNLGGLLFAPRKVTKKRHRPGQIKPKKRAQLRNY